MNLVLRHLSVLMGFSPTERCFTISPSRLRYECMHVKKCIVKLWGWFEWKLYSQCYMTSIYHNTSLCGVFGNFHTTKGSISAMVLGNSLTWIDSYPSQTWLLIVFLFLTVEQMHNKHISFILYRWRHFCSELIVFLCFVQVIPCVQCISVQPVPCAGSQLQYGHPAVAHLPTRVTVLPSSPSQPRPASPHLHSMVPPAPPSTLLVQSCPYSLVQGQEGWLNWVIFGLV